MSCYSHCKQALPAHEARHIRRLFEVRGLPARVIAVALLTVLLAVTPRSPFFERIQPLEQPFFEEPLGAVLESDLVRFPRRL